MFAFKTWHWGIKHFCQRELSASGSL
jgi:hypothetical protein